MKVYLWAHIQGIYLLNEDLSMWAKPYFITHPQRTLILKKRQEDGMSKEDLLSTVSNDELQQLLENAVIRWKPMLSSMVDVKGNLLGFAENPIAIAEIKNDQSI